MSLIYIDPKTNGKLFQAGASEIPSILFKNNIFMLILAAEEYQPEYIHAKNFEDIHKFYLPLDDGDFISRNELKSINKLADFAVVAILNGKSVLSTCYLGRNRSGLISGTILKKLTRLPGEQIIAHIQMNRYKALRNEYFNNILKSNLP